MRGNPPDEPDDDAVVEVITEVEVLDGPLVLAPSPRQVTRVAPPGGVLVQTAAVAATGFVAGVATAAVLGRRRQRRLTGPATTSLPDGAYRAVSHRTYLVDVHLLERR